MKAYKKLQTRYHEKVKETYRTKIKCFVIIFIMIVVVACFIGLVIGLSLGLKTSSQCDNNYSYCGGRCANTKIDNENCGGCGKTCAFDATCVQGSCAFCQHDCSSDSFFCTIPPCSNSTGCTIFDCSTDGDACTLNPCNGTFNACTPLDCDNDVDYCTIGPCNSASGCGLRDCTTLGNPCLTNPCQGGACSYQCPTLLLSPPNSNFSSALTVPTGAPVFYSPASSTLSLTSVPSVTQATVTANFQSPSSFNSLNMSVASSGAYTSSFGSNVLTITPNAPSAAASVFQTALQSFAVSFVPSVQGSYTLNFIYQVTNTVPRSLPQTIISSLLLTVN